MIAWLKWSVTAGVVLAAIGCGGHKASRDRSPVRSAHKECTPTAVHTRSPPAWTDIPDVPDPPFYYAIDEGDQIAAFFFTFPLRAGMGPDDGNKVLWVVGHTAKAPRLAIVARSGGRFVHSAGEAGFGSGQIQRTALRLPRPGCWRLDLRWGANRTWIDVRVARRSAARS